MASASPRADTFQVPGCLDTLNRRTQKQPGDFQYMIPCTRVELGPDAEFITLERGDIADIASMQYIGARVIQVYQR